MSRRDWPLIVQCGHDGCSERATYRYQTRRDLMDSFELKNYSKGRWRCVRHSRPDEVLSLNNRETRIELCAEKKEHGMYFGNFGFVHGPGFKAFAKDFPEGTKIVVTATLIPPSEQAS